VDEAEAGMLQISDIEASAVESTFCSAGTVSEEESTNISPSYQPRSNLEEDGAIVERYEYERIVGQWYSRYKNRKGKIVVKVKWSGFSETTWEFMEVIKKDDPETLAKYAIE